MYRRLLGEGEEAFTYQGKERAAAVLIISALKSSFGTDEICKEFVKIRWLTSWKTSCTPLMFDTIWP